MLTNMYDTYRSNTSSDKSKEQQILRQLEEAMAKNPIQHERRVPNIFECASCLLLLWGGAVRLRVGRGGRVRC